MIIKYGYLNIIYAISLISIFNKMKKVQHSWGNSFFTEELVKYG
jgi:hypothetical protein